MGRVSACVAANATSRRLVLKCWRGYMELVVSMWVRVGGFVGGSVGKGGWIWGE